MVIGRREYAEREQQRLVRAKHRGHTFSECEYDRKLLLVWKVCFVESPLSLPRTQHRHHHTHTTQHTQRRGDNPPSSTEPLPIIYAAACARPAAGAATAGAAAAAVVVVPAAAAVIVSPAGACLRSSLHE